jgi:hypothetical protein
VTDGVAFEVFGETHDPRLSDLLAGLPDAGDAPFAASPSAAE